MIKLSSEKYTILLIILIFIIPLIALDSSFYFITKIIDFDSAQKKQEKEAIHEAESLAIEGNFSNEFSIYFRDFFDILQKTANIKNVTDNFLINRLETASNKIFEEPFPKSNLYVFRIPINKQQAELIYYNGSLKSGKRALCKTFEQLYSLNNENQNEPKIQIDSLTKTLLGKYTDIKAIAQEMRGITTNTNGIHKNSWFIWDYTKVDGKGIFGVIIFCDEIKDFAKYGRLLALKKLKTRGKAIGAFIPIYKEYGEAVIQPPLDKSRKFNNWIKKLTIEEEKDLDKWLINSLPQGEILGNYTAFCHLERGDSHIAVVLVKSLKINLFPKWLIFTNFILIFILLIIIYNGLAFRIWPNVNLKARFIISYALASIVPLSLLCVTSYGYILKYEKTAEEQAINKLQKSLKEFDAYKLSIIKDYRTAFTKIIKDPKLIELIRNNDINNNIITKTAVKIFENKEDKNNYLPILGIKIYDEIGEGSLASGTTFTNLDTNTIFDSFDSTMVNLLRDEIKKENKGINLKEYKPNQEKEFANDAYKSLSNRDLKNDIYRLNSIPIPRQNGNYCNYFIYDTIKIKGKSKYILFLVWDDKTLDERIIKRAMLNNTLKNLDQNFIAYKINGQKIEIVSEKTRHTSQNIIEKTTDLAKQSSHLKKTENYVDNNNIIVVSPAYNFNQTIFVGWIDKIDIISDITNRKIAFIILIIISLLTLWVCSLHSSSLFLKPITSLKKALDEVSFGNLNIGFKDNPDNELGKLSDEFNKMIEELREKERLSKLISDQAVQALKKNSTGLLNDTETFKGVALVSDIRNFTGMSEKYDPTIITELLNEHFAEMAKIISENGGLIYKFIGDAIEAVFPEKLDFEKSASERAFTTGCMMLAKLKSINTRRKKIGLFPYKIGVGLCYGTLYSGSVGSIETRLDYSILGEPLKKAAKLEALTIQNPDYPLTLDESIAEKMASLGFGFKAIDSRGQGFNVYTLNEIGINPKINSSSDFTKNKIIKNEKKKEKNDNIYYFSLSNISFASKLLKKPFSYSFFVLFISLLITFGIFLLYKTRYDNLKSESDKEAIRLNEQLKCNDVLKSCFEYVCFDFYEDLNKAIKSEDDPKVLKEIIEEIYNKYTNKGYPIPYYCCCLLNHNNKTNYDSIISKGFHDEACKLFLKYARAYKKYSGRDDEDEKLNVYIKPLMGPASNFYSLKSVFLRRSSQTSILNEEMLLDTEIIYDKEHIEPIAYIFCGMPKIIKDKNLLSKYYTALAGKQFFMAIKSKDGWNFSEDFPEDEKNNFTKQENNNLINKDYFTDNDNIEINYEPYKVYTISKDLFFFHKSKFKLSIITFSLSLFILTLLFIIIEKSKIIFNNSITGILRKDIILSALIPILTVTFVSNLYVEEEFNGNKTELTLNLNKLINEVESREYYYSPHCENTINNLSKREEILNFINNIKNTKGDDQVNNCNELSKYLKKYVMGRKYRNFNNYKTNPYFVIKEISLIGKDDWMASATDNDSRKEESSGFGQIMSKAIKDIYFETNSDKKKAKEGVENELIARKMMEILSSGFGSDLSIRIINLPNNLILLSSSYASIGFYLSCIPDINNPDYIIVSLLYFEPEIFSELCSKKNKRIPYKNHLESGSLDDELYCFYSPNINVGDFFELGKNYKIEKDEFKTIKEFGLVSSWINTSYIPLSKNINLNGKHYLEAKQGNIVKDNVYLAIGSEYPLNKTALENIKNFAYIIILSIIMIFLIAQCIISDLLDPVKKLINGAGAASKGNFKFRTNFKRKDELGALCDSFDKMMKGLEEKQLMNRMVSKTALKVASNLSDIESKKVDVALLYVTVPNFDKIMKNMPAYELFSKLREQIAIISEIVIENGGDIDKIMGEKLLIAFHLGDKTAQEIAANASKVAVLIENCDKLYFKVSVGVNFGEVISGYLGVGEKRDFTIIGDPVNVAARIAVFAEKLDNCLISETIYKYISNNISAKLYGEVELKGKSKPMKVYQLS